MLFLYGPICYLDCLLPLTGQECGKGLMRVLLGGLKVPDTDIKVDIISILLNKGIHNVIP